MGNPGWLFALAAVIAVLGITAAFKQMIGELEAKLEKQEPVTQESFQSYISRFFMKVALIEAIPIIFIVLGFIQMEGPENIYQTAMLLPIVVVSITWLFGIANIFLTRSRIITIPDLSEQSKKLLYTLLFLGAGMVSAIPIVSVVAMVIMTN